MNRKQHRSRRALLGIATAAAMAASLMTTAVRVEAGDISGEQADPVLAGADGKSSPAVGTISVTVPDSSDVKSVRAYQIVDGYYQNNKLVRYVLMDPENGKIAAIGSGTGGQESVNDIITPEEAAVIAGNIETGKFTADPGVSLKKGEKGTYSADVEPGMYLVLVDGAGACVYAPAVLSVNITDVNSGALEGSSVDMSHFFTYSDGSTTTNAYIKASKPEIDKKIMSSDKTVCLSSEDGKLSSLTSLAVKTAGKDGSGRGDTVAVGDVIHFQLDGITVPSYSEDYTSPKYCITDQLEPEAFAAIQNLKIYIDDSQVTPGEDGVYRDDQNQKIFTLKKSEDGRGFSVEFDADYLKNGANFSAAGKDGGNAVPHHPTVKITYDSALTEKAGLNFAENTNHAEVRYSADPKDKDGCETISENTHHYTFGIDAALGEEGDTSDFEKTTEFDKTSGKTTNNWESGGTARVSDRALQGAEFTLYRDEDCKEPVRKRKYDEVTGISSEDVENETATSDADGHFTFAGLDEGTYYMKETGAPSGYALSPVEYRFVIAAEFNESDVLSGYTVSRSFRDTSDADSSWSEEDVCTYTADEQKIAEDGSVTNTISAKGDPMDIVDTRLRRLPGTGGAGIAGLITAAGLAGAVGVILDGNKKKAHSVKKAGRSDGKSGPAV